MTTKLRSQQAGHYEIHGETIAKFEFFENGFNPYSRYLDADKVDLILRKKMGDTIKYFDVQVKYGRLYECKPKWQRNLFDLTSWRFFKPNEFSGTQSLYVAYILSAPHGYRGDIFIFPSITFNKLINQAIPCNTKKGKQFKMFIAHSKLLDKWYLWKKWKFHEITEDSCLNVTEFRRNFSQICG